MLAADKEEEVRGGPEFRGGRYDCELNPTAQKVGPGEALHALLKQSWVQTWRYPEPTDTLLSVRGSSEAGALQVSSGS